VDRFEYKGCVAIVEGTWYEISNGNRVVDSGTTNLTAEQVMKNWNGVSIRSRKEND